MILTERFDTPEKKKHLLNRIALVPVAAALAVAEHYLDGRGTCRVPGRRLHSDRLTEKGEIW